MKHNNILIYFALAAMLFAGCGGRNYSPKPQAYLRIDMPEHNYVGTDTMPACATLPFSFEMNNLAALSLKEHTQRDMWVDINYPQWDGVVFLTHRRLRSPDSLRSQVDESTRLLEQHYQVTSGVEEQRYEDPEHRVYGTVYYLKGRKVASTCQFWLTDSTRNFLRGALFINHTPNNDSLAPVIGYMQADIEHLVETLRWRD